MPTLKALFEDEKQPQSFNVRQFLLDLPDECIDGIKNRIERKCVDEGRNSTEKEKQLISLLDSIYDEKNFNKMFENIKFSLEGLSLILTEFQEARDEYARTSANKEFIQIRKGISHSDENKEGAERFDELDEQLGRGMNEQIERSLVLTKLERFVQVMDRSFT